MVENHHEGGCVGRGGGDDVREVGIGELAHLEHDTLMRAMARDGVELCSRHALDAHAGVAETGEQVADRLLALHALGDKGALDGKPGAQRLERGASPLYVVALGGVDVTPLWRRGLLSPRRLGRAMLDGRPGPAAPRAPRAAVGPALRLALIFAALLRALLLCHLGPFQSDSLADIVTSRRAKCTRPQFTHARRTRTTGCGAALRVDARLDTGTPYIEARARPA